MRRWLKTLGYLLSATLLLAVIGLFLPDRFYQLAAESLTQTLTDRDLHIGDIRVQRGLQTIIELSDISFANAEWSDRKTMLKAGSVTASINLRALIRGMLEISNLSFSGLDVHLEKNTQDQFNWQLSENSDNKPDLSRIKLLELSANNNVIEYTDHGADLQYKLELQSLYLHTENHARIPDIRARGVVNGFPVVINTLSQIPKSESPEQVPFGIEASIGDIAITAIGDIDTSNGNAMLNGDVSLHVDSLQDLTQLVQVESPIRGPLDMTATVEGNLATLKDDGLDISDITLHLDDKTLTVDATGSFTGIPQNIEGDAHLNINLLDTEELLRVAGINRSLPGRAHIEATLTTENGRVDMSLHQAHLESDLLYLQLSGEIDDVLDSALVTVDVDIETPDMGFITHLFGPKMPPEWGPISASGQLTGNNGQYAIDQIVATLSGNSTATATGSIASLSPFDNMHLDVEANLSTLTEVSAFTAKPLPHIGPFYGNGAVVWKNRKLSLVDARASYDGPLGIAVATGGIGDLIRFDRVRLRADADLPDFKALDLFTGFTMPPVDGVVVSTNLFSTEARDLSARNLNVTARKNNAVIRAEGSVDSIIKNKAILDLKLATQVDSIRQLEGLVNRELPDIGPVSATAQLVGSKQDIELVDVAVTLNDALLSGRISSDVGYLNRIETLSLDADLESASVKDVLAKFGIDSNVIEPATLSSQVLVDLNRGSVRLDDARLTIADNTLVGELDLLHLTDPDTRSRISGALHLMDWNVMKLRDRPMGLRSVNDDPSSTKNTGMLLSDAPLPFGVIARNDIDLTIQVGQLMSTLLDVSDATLNLLSNDGLLVVGPFSGVVNQGKADFYMTVDTNQNPPELSLAVTLKEFDLARAGLLQNADLIENTGRTTVMLKLDGQGDSIADILGSANGEGSLYIEDLVLKQGVLKVLSSDLLDQLVDAINPSKQRSKETRIMCSALAFQLDSGKLETPLGFAVESDKFAILGNANINLKDESMKIVISSKPKKGFGFGLNRFVNLVEIEGQLATPKLSLSESGLLRLGASLAAAVASSGVSLLAEGFWETQLANSNVCAQALGNQPQ